MTDELLKKIADGRMKRDQQLIDNLKVKMPELEKMLEKMTGHWTYEDLIYRYYHSSFKVFYLKDATKQIVDLLKTVMPDRELNKDFLEIYEDGQKQAFGPTTNQEWSKQCRPVVEAFFHAKYFLEMAVKYGKELEKAPNTLPSGWAGFLYLYDMR